MSDKKLPQIPTPEAMFLDAGLYQHFRLDPERISAIEWYNGSLDLFCIECGKETVFQAPDSRPDAGYLVPNQSEADRLAQSHSRALVTRTFVKSFECSRNQKHVATFCFRVGADSFLKIGQFPSKADVQTTRLRKYRKALGPAYHRELSTAVGLEAHGIGIGSFVYLRRIFEHLVEEAASHKAREDTSWDIAQWQRERMDDKIKHIAEYLPQTLVEYSALYPILSKGLHQLSESECLEYFGTVKTGIELILDERLAQQETERKRKSLSDNLGRLTGKLRS